MTMMMRRDRDGDGGVITGYQLDLAECQGHKMRREGVPDHCKAIFGDFHLQNNPYTEERRSAKCGLNQGGEGIYMNFAEK